MRQSINRNIVAQFYSQVVTFAIQIGTVPFLLVAWGIERYGVWLLISAIPAYLALADFGFTFIAKNDMAMRYSAGDKHGALVTYQSVFCLLVLICIILAIVLWIAIFLLPLNEWFNFGRESIQDVKLVLFLQFLSVLLYQFFLLFCSGIRCEGLFATESALAASGRLVEAFSIVIIAVSGGGLLAASFGALIVRLLFLLGTGVWLKIRVKWLSLGFINAERERLRELTVPSLTYMLLPISNALVIQGPLVILGALVTPMAVALYSVTRTVARLGMSGANMLAYAFTPAYSQAWGAKNYELFFQLINKHKKLFLIGLIAYLLVSIPFATKIILIISKNHLSPDLALCIVMIIGVCFEMIWNSLFAPLAAINEHSKLPMLILLSSIAIISLGVIFHTPMQLSILIVMSQFLVLILVIKMFYYNLILKKVIYD